MKTVHQQGQHDTEFRMIYGVHKCKYSAIW